MRVRAHSLSVPFYRRRLPHLYEPGVPVFVAWRLEDSLPPRRNFDARAMTSFESFLALDQLLDETRSGAKHLAISAIADLVIESITHCETVLHQYELHAFIVMPNHVHLLITPDSPLPKTLNSLKSFTARRANALLSRSGRAFWLAESYDHLVRDRLGFESIRRYIEENPVRALLVRRAEEYAWSSAHELAVKV